MAGTRARAMEGGRARGLGRCGPRRAVGAGAEIDADPFRAGAAADQRLRPPAGRQCRRRNQMRAAVGGPPPAPPPTHPPALQLWTLTAADDGTPAVSHAASLTGHSRGVNCARFSPTGTALASAGDGGEVFLWRPAAPGPAPTEWRLAQVLR